jgi:L-alanine-DL-glutamate epimerase-like enolase superfamily enzyme
MQLTLHQHELKLAHPFGISRETRTVQPTLIVALHSDGLTGLGEATSNLYYNITLAGMVQQLERLRPVIEAVGDVTPEEFWRIMHPHLADNAFALCALDVAYHDLYARKKGKKLYELWGYTTEQAPLSDYTIGIDTLEKMVAKMQERPWPIYKIKLGTSNDLAIVRELRRHTDAVFRVDANCAWGVEETLANAVELKQLGVEFIEQPLKADNWAGHKVLFENAVLPIIADESCIIEADVARCHQHFHGVNIKLMKCGGLTVARRMMAQARSLGMKTMVGCMTESTVGISAIAQLLPELDYVDMDGALLLAEDIASGVTLHNGQVSYANENGTGAVLFA